MVEKSEAMTNPDAPAQVSAVADAPSNSGWLEKLFQINARGSSILTEFIAALTTFATMSYVLAVHPTIMADAGLDKATMITVTALAAGIFSILLGLMANLPIAQAPGMGSNALFAYTIILVMGVPWQAALGLVFWSGIFFLLLTLTGLRQILLNAFPDAIKTALVCGIGLFLLFLGLKAAGVVVAAPSPMLVGIGKISSPIVLVSLMGVPVIAAMMSLKIPGGIILTILAITVTGMFIPLHDEVMITQLPASFTATPVSPTSVWMALDLGYLWTHFAYAFPVLLSLIFIDLFSSLVVINAMTVRAGLAGPEGDPVSLQKALTADALATVGGAMMGTSTTNVYGESATGIESGGRTGLTPIIVGVFFLLAMFITPLIMIIPPQATAPALIYIGLLMFFEVSKIDFSDIPIAVPAALCIILMPVTSISDGLAIGLLCYVISMSLCGRIREVNRLTWAMAASFVFYYSLS